MFLTRRSLFNISSSLSSLSNKATSSLFYNNNSRQLSSLLLTFSNQNQNQSQYNEKKKLNQIFNHKNHNGGSSSSLFIQQRNYVMLPQQQRQPPSLSFFTGKRSPYLDFVHNLEDRLQRLKDLQAEEHGSTYNNNKSSSSSSSSSSSTTNSTTVVDSSVVYPTWLLQKDLEARLNCTMKTIHFRRIIATLNQIWIQPNSHLELEYLNQFKRSLDTHQKVEKIIKPDAWGRYMATGYRKTAYAKAWVSEGTGEILINGKRLDQYFGRPVHRQTVIKPFVMTESLGTKNTFVIVSGSGHTGQSDAIQLAISKCLACMVPDKKLVLKKADMLKRDTRIVERKKYGQRKARRKFQWVKR